MTLLGNTFNGASQLVQLTAGGLLPVLDGSNLTNVAAATASTLANTNAAGASVIAALTTNGGTLTNNISGNAATASLLNPGANINGVLFIGGAASTNTAYMTVAAVAYHGGTYPNPSIVSLPAISGALLTNLDVGNI